MSPNFTFPSEPLVQRKWKEVQETRRTNQSYSSSALSIPWIRKLISLHRWRPYLSWFTHLGIVLTILLYFILGDSLLHCQLCSPTSKALSQMIPLRDDEYEEDGTDSNESNVVANNEAGGGGGGKKIRAGKKFSRGLGARALPAKKNCGSIFIVYGNLFCKV